MSTPIHSLGYRFLQRTLQHEHDSGESRFHLSRRGFLLAASVLTSCTAKKPQEPEPLPPARMPRTRIASAPAPLEAMPPTPNVKRPVQHNPDLQHLSSNFPRNGAMTYNHAVVSGKFIAITFDDGPHPENTPRLLSILRERNIKATFFVVGNSVDAYPNVLRNTIAEGHEIGNHSQTHRLLSKLDDTQLRWELGSCRDAVRRAAGYDMQLMRPPYGGIQQRQRELVHAEFGYPSILWSVDPLDWKRPGSSVVASRIIRATQPGGIILAHDIHAPTVAAMPSTLDELLYRGFQFVTVSQLLAMNAPQAQLQSAPTNS